MQEQTMAHQFDDFSLEILMKNRAWSFGNLDTKAVVSPRLTLRSGGHLQDYSHPNENAWRVKAGAVEFLNQDGAVSTRFDRISENDGKYTMEGRFRLGGTGETHYLQDCGEIARPLNRTALVVPIHDAYFMYGINLLYQSVGSDYDIVFVFSTDADRRAFATMHQPSASLYYHAIVLDDHFTGGAISVVADRKTWPTVKKFLALSLVHKSYDYILCVDAETFILRPTGWTAAAEQVVSQARWYAGLLTQKHAAERNIMHASSMALSPHAEHADIQAISRNWGFYSWWWDIPVYAAGSVSGFLNWMEWDTSLQFVERFAHNLYDHITYQFYMGLHGGFSFVPVEGIAHSLEFKPAAMVGRVHREINPVRWANAFAYAQDPDFFRENDYLAIYHIDRKSFPQFELA
ncbi:hypothetical protein ACQZ4Y_16495 [Rhizobium sp. L80/93]|uniref:hypothetical protein n=2 Tax=unclassified Rhizobium TaxID=2613769 RepID=UPI001ADCF8F2|nr:MULTISPECIES: hypothetical protein [unclassified Rhizobium]MBO9133974.1 hypothetical protein [Rhizobium sp. B209b/85]MBO9097174.1 hypothetical protein [Rhizobium sp. L58/93]QXZ83710.1 hypothetical protein J5287_17000 [Rhizobium sp. K1/93]QXZ88778.1 hypothetical protein J5280_11590 [Rhizobium sp. K15/93]QYA01365.1 hypothetical protein J5278_16845 [Rhizobium sp. B21/90]